MSIVIGLSNLSSNTCAGEIAQFFNDINIDKDNVHLVIGESSRAFFEVDSQENVRKALVRDGSLLNGSFIKVFISTHSKMCQAIGKKCSNVPTTARPSFTVVKSLELICEWENCNLTFTDRSLYLSHINKTHVRTFGTKLVTTCKWQGCFEESEFQHMDQFQLHLSFHAFHNQLMYIGKQVMDNTTPKPTCYMDTSTKNFLSDISSVLLCGWTDCCAEFFDAESFFIHVDTHATEDVDIPMMSKEKLKKIRYANCKWLKCNASFKTKSHLKNHLRSHTQKKVIACPVCGVWFCNRIAFLNHCYRQETPTSVENKYAHMKSESDDEEEGMLTIDEDANPSSIVIHLPHNLQNILPSQATLINSCDELNIANEVNSSDNKTEIQDENMLLSKASSLNAIVTDQATTGNSTSTSKVALLVNFNLIQNDSDITATASDTGLSNNVIQLKLRTADIADDVVRPFKCDQCPKSFNTKALLHEHVSKHDRRYKCHQCAYSANFPYRLKEHILFRHSEKFDYKCQFCDQKFKAQRFLHRHIELHGSSKKLMCEICKKTYTNFYSLNRHVRISHIEENIMFACHICDNKVYNRGSNLSRHLVNAHHFKTASGFCRFVYDKNHDGVYRINRACYVVAD